MIVIDDDVYFLQIAALVARDIARDCHLVRWKQGDSLGDYCQTDASLVVSLDLPISSAAYLEFSANTLTPIIFVSRWDENPLVSMLRRAGPVEILRRPIRLSALREVFRGLPKRSTGARRLETHNGCINISATVSIDIGAKRILSANGICVPVTEREMNILIILRRAGGEAISRDVISRLLTEKSLETIDRTVDVHISNLRRKLRESGINEVNIITRRNAGYSLVYTGDEHSS